MTGRWIAVVMICLGVAGCATLSESQCQQGDWFQIGEKDGREGYALDRLAKHREACSEYGVSPNTEAYEKGRREGLKAYCNPATAYRLGRTGGYYRGGCPADLEGAFLAKFEAGKQVRKVEEQVSSLYKEITDLENEMDKEPDATKRQALRERLRTRQREKEELQRRLTVLEIKGET